jgi:hypothetical protein
MEFPKLFGSSGRKACQKNHHIQVHTTITTNFFNIVLTAVVNSNYEFIMADASINGRISDRGVLGNL